MGLGEELLEAGVLGAQLGVRGGRTFEGLASPLEEGRLPLVDLRRVDPVGAADLGDIGLLLAEEE